MTDSSLSPTTWGQVGHFPVHAMTFSVAPGGQKAPLSPDPGRLRGQESRINNLHHFPISRLPQAQAPHKRAPRNKRSKALSHEVPGQPGRDSKRDLTRTPGWTGDGTGHLPARRQNPSPAAAAPHGVRVELLCAPGKRVGSFQEKT